MTRKKKQPVAPAGKLTYNRRVNPSFTEQLRRGECCPRQCGIDRLAGKTGFCKVDGTILLAHTGLHHGEEPPISGTRGSGTVFFAGCNLHCAFCQNWQISQAFHLSKVRTCSPDELAEELLSLQADGAHNINFVSPSHMVAQLADTIQRARQKGLRIPIVYNSNGYDSVKALQQIHGLIDIYLPDLKYTENALGAAFSGTADYADIVPAVLREMLAQVGRLELDRDGIAVRGLLVRHLVLPNHLENSKACLKFLAELDPKITVSIMSQYSPQYKACGIPALNRPLTASEYNEITDYALDLGLENAFIQTLDSQETYLPDFSHAAPFGLTPADSE